MASSKGKIFKYDSPDPDREGDRKYVNSWRQKIPMFERIYEMSSAAMLERTKSGQARPTKEIAQWMEAYHILEKLGQLPPTAGSAPPPYLFRNRRASKAGVISEEVVSDKTRIRKIDGNIYKKQLLRRVRTWENRYEIPSSEMLELISCGKEADTVDVLLWMSDYHRLKEIENFSGEDVKDDA